VHGGQLRTRGGDGPGGGVGVAQHRDVGERVLHLLEAEAERLHAADDEDLLDVLLRVEPEAAVGALLLQQEVGGEGREVAAGAGQRLDRERLAEAVVAGVRRGERLDGVGDRGEGLVVTRVVELRPASTVALVLGPKLVWSTPSPSASCAVSQAAAAAAGAVS